MATDVGELERQVAIFHARSLLPHAKALYETLTEDRPFTAGGTDAKKSGPMVSGACASKAPDRLTPLLEELIAVVEEMEGEWSGE